MRIRRSVIASVLLLLVTAGMAQAYMPIALENVIKTWFSSAGKLVGFRIYESPAAPPASGTNDCRLYVDATSNSLMASCGTKAYTYLVGGSATTPCTQDVDGNMTCNTFVSTDQNGAGIANSMSVISNEVALTPDPTCANYGVANRMTVLDVIEGTTSTDTYGVCNGATETWSFPTTQALALLTPYNVPATAAAADTAALSANQLRCMRYTPPWTKTVTQYSTWTRTVGAASETVAVCVYNDSDAAASLISDMGRVVIDDDEDVDTSTAVTGFTLRAGTTVRVCWTSKDTSVLFLGAPVNGIVSDNANPLIIGNAAEVSTGTTSTLACPTLTGALTRVTTAGAQIELF